MTSDFISRLIGMMVFVIIGARLGLDVARALNLPQDTGSFFFGLLGLLSGLILTPWITVRPVRALRRAITEMPVERLIMSSIGMAIGLMLALLISYPLSLLGSPVGAVLPTVVSLLMGYLGMSIVGSRSRELITLLNMRPGRGQRAAPGTSRRLLLDTSVLIDGRIVDIAESGFLGGILVVPRFVLNELHRVADSSDPLRRNRGRRGLNMLTHLQRSDVLTLRIVDDDFDEITEVDNKLVALALEMNAALVTNDFNLNQVADAQGVTVLNINKLSNAVRSAYIPGETFPIRIIQEGRDPDQGVGYLDDGTMVVVENGKDYVDRIINVTVTKLINRDTGRMIFAIPEN